MSIRVASRVLTQCRGVRKKGAKPPRWLEDATTFEDAHTVLTDSHQTMAYPVEQLRSYLHEQEVKKHVAKKEKNLRPRRLDVLDFSHIPIEQQFFVLFPGQGAQFVGMGKQVIDHSPSKRIFDQANEILGYDLTSICLNGPISKLSQTIYCQPAMFVTSMAALEKMRHDIPEFDERATETAGFSVGEFAALVFSGVLKFDDALRIVKARAEAMHECNQRLSSGMITVKVNAKSHLETAIKEAQKFAEERGIMPVCDLANFLYCGMKVVGGANECLNYLKQNAERFNYSVAKDLPVSGAFHTILQTPAEQVLRQCLKNVELGTPRMNLYSNFTGRTYPSKPFHVRENIIKQVSNPVKWEQIMQLMYRKHQDNVFPEFVEVGAGKQLGTILYNISKKAYKNYTHISC